MIKHLLLAVFIILPIVTNAKTITVTSSLDSGANSLREAISSAQAGDIIQFSDDVNIVPLSSELSLGDKTITIDGLKSNGDKVVIDGQSACRCFNIDVAENVDVLIQNLDVRNGFVTLEYGACIKVNNTNGTFNLENCLITGGNTSIGTYSFAIYSSGSAIAIEGTADNSIVFNCKIQDNHNPGSLAAVYANGAYFINCLITDNDSYSFGGIFVKNSTFINCTIANNISEDSVSGASNSCTYINSIVLGDEYSPYKGNTNNEYINCVGEHPLEHTTNYRQIAEYPFADMAGGDYSLANTQSGWYCIDGGDESLLPSDFTEDINGDVRIRYNTVDIGAIEFEYDVARTEPAILMVKSESSDPLVFSSFSNILAKSIDGDTIIIDSVLVSNIAISSDLMIGDKNLFIEGAGVSLVSDGSSRILNVLGVEDKKVTLHNLVFKDGNSTGNGGAINADLTEGELEVTGCVFVNNQSSGDGGAVATVGGSYINCSFIGNTALNGGGVNAAGAAVFTNCLMWNNANDNLRVVGDLCTVSNSALPGGFTNGNNNVDLTATPFVDEANANYYLNGLENGLACLDAGDNNSVPSYHTTDLLGNRAIKYHTTDIGAYESDFIRLTAEKLVVTSSSNSIDDAYSLPWCVYHAVDGDTITFDPTITEVLLDESLVIGKAIYINGALADGQKVQISGQDQYIVLKINTTEDQHVDLLNLHIRNGYSEVNGGGILTNNNTDVLIKNCIITDCKADVEGGGIYQKGKTIISECEFYRNYADLRGGAILCGGNANSYIENCVIRENKSRTVGGGIACFFSSSNIYNCLIEGNSGGRGGGLAIYYFQGQILNCSILNNVATRSFAFTAYGGGVYCLSMNGGKFYNCIISGNRHVTSTEDEPDEYAGTDSQGVTTLSNCAIRGGETNVFWGTSNYENIIDLSASPCKDETNEDFSLNPDSEDGQKCINAGSDGFVKGILSYDFEKKPRIIGESVDLGYIEYKGAGETQYFMVTNESADEMVEQSLPWCVKNAENNDVIEFANNVDKITLTSELTLGAGSLTIDGLKSNGDTIVLDGNTESRIFNVDIANASILNVTNLILQNGYTDEYGGAILANITDGSFAITNSTFKFNRSIAGGAIDADGNVTITNCRLYDNVAEGFYGEGGAVTAYDGVVINDCDIMNNSAINGGGIYAGNNTSWSNCRIYNNKASESGGGVYAYSESTIDNCIITNNEAKENGGGIFCNSSPIILQCQIGQNEAYNGGGVYYQFGGKLVNCNIVNNHAKSRAGGAFFFSSGDMYNSIVWGNTADDSKPQIYASGTSMNINNCAVEDGYTGNGAGSGDAIPRTLVSTPFFNDDDPLDFRLNTNEGGGAECIDKGDDSEITSIITSDINGNDRINRKVDIGVYEGAFSSVVFTTVGDGDISGDLEQVVKYLGDASEVEASANDGSTFKGWYNGSELFSSEVLLALKNITTNINLVAYFDSETGIGDSESDQSIKVYSTQATINVESSLVIDEVKVYSTSGNLVKVVTPHSTNCMIEMSEFTQGIYIVSVNSNAQINITKVYLRR
nr:right-handed parallel beta-helix repeat-containing protein [uncultured Carboxylicivirga sp.]